MRLDKYVSDSTALTRSLAKKAISSGKITINGKPQKSSAYKVLDTDSVCHNGALISTRTARYIMLNKPMNTVCSTVADTHPSVLELIDLEKKDTLHIAGRLDQDTTGLVLITDDGKWSHKITSPKAKCAKVYFIETFENIDSEYINNFKEGMLLKGEDKPTLPAVLEIVSEKTARLTILEGRYHQVKRMFAAMGNNVEALHRESIGNIMLDPSLAPGEWRYLTPEEVG